MKKILLVFTGGTIGSQAVDGAIDTDQAAGFKLLQLFKRQDSDPDSVSFKTLQPLQILSENLHPHAWTKLIAAIEEEDLSRFDGVIVTHGTDTLAFTAAALGLYFNFLQIPLLLVSSDLPLENPLANGLPNFLCAVDFIRQVRLRGVYAPYRNSGSDMRIYPATRLASSLQLSSDFIGVQSKAFMLYEERRFRPLQAMAEIERAPLMLKADFSARIQLLRPYPGLDYSQINLNNVDAVLHDLYHSGTACASTANGEEYSLLGFIRRCRRQGLPIYLAPALKSENAYGSTRQLMAEGAEMIWNMSLEAAYAKLLLAYGNFKNAREIAEFLERDLAGEHV